MTFLPLCRGEPTLAGHVMPRRADVGRHLNVAHNVGTKCSSAHAFIYKFHTGTALDALVIDIEAADAPTTFVEEPWPVTRAKSAIGITGVAWDFWPR